jgi:hypothetical protein
MYMCIYVYMYICIYVYMYICIYVYMYICMYVNNIYIYVCACTYTCGPHIYIYMVGIARALSHGLSVIAVAPQVLHHCVTLGVASSKAS